MGQVLSEIEVSVVIVNYNSFQMLDECLASLFKYNNDTRFEVILIDNNSTEGKVESVTFKYAGINLIRNTTNTGFASANNKGLAHVTGKYTLFLNNDTLVQENSLRKVLDFAESFNEPVFVGCQLLNSDGSKQENVVEFPSLWNTFTENFFLYKIFPRSQMFNKYYQNYLILNSPIEVDVIRGAFMLCPTAKLKELKGFDERFYFYSEETDLCYRFKKSGGRIFYYPLTSIIHHGGASADKNLWFKFKNQATGKIQYYQKHIQGFTFFIILFFHYLGLSLRGILFAIGGILILKKDLVIKGLYFFRQILVYPKNLFKQ